MSKYTLLLVMLLIAVSSSAQLPDGSVAPNFAVTDINGQQHNLTTILGQGKTVVLMFGTTWSLSSWKYHEVKALQQLYLAHGPQGDNRVEIFFVESDANTSAGCLTGTTTCNSSTLGNWTSGITYPIVNSSQLAAEFNVTSFPTIYAICPTRRTRLMQQLGAVPMWDQLKECPVAAGVRNAGLYFYDLGIELKELCGETEVRPQFALVNLGTQALTQATINVRWNSDELQTFEWTGNLSTLQQEEISLNSLIVNEPGVLRTQLTLPNGDDSAVDNLRSDTLCDATNFETPVVVLRLRTDSWGSDTYWEIRQDNGTVIDFGGNSNVGPDGGGVLLGGQNSSSSSYNSNTTIRDTIALPGPGCYSFHISDAYGDGLCCDYGNGYYRLFNLGDGSGTPLLQGGKFKSYDRHQFGAGTVGDNRLPAFSNLRVDLFPNPATDFLQLEFDLPTSKQAMWSVYNTLGQLLYQQPPMLLPAGLSVQQLDLANWPAGNYQIVIKSESGDLPLTYNFVVMPR